MWPLIGSVCVIALLLVLVCSLHMAKIDVDEEHDDAILRAILEEPVDARELARQQVMPEPLLPPPALVAEPTPMPAVFRRRGVGLWMHGGNAHQRRLVNRFLSRGAV